MLSRPFRLIALLARSDRRRLAASFLAPLLFGLSFGCGYVEALTVGVTDVLTPLEQPPVATMDHGAVSLTAPQPAVTGIVVTRIFDVEVEPLRPVQDRAPPALAS
jgi:hypothetical protein